MLSSWKYQSRFENTAWLTTKTLPMVLPRGAGSTRTPRLANASSTDSRSMPPSARFGSSPPVWAVAGDAATSTASAGTHSGRRSKHLRRRMPFTRSGRILPLRSSRAVARPWVSLSFQLGVGEEGLMHVKLDELRGRKVFDANGRAIGIVQAALVDMETW